jgi:hypothetical protein
MSTCALHIRGKATAMDHSLLGRGCSAVDNILQRLGEGRGFPLNKEESLEKGVRR